MTRMNRMRMCGLFAGAVTFAVAASASAATRTVGNGATACRGATYATIQAAVSAAAPHDEISVCPGTYAEQITIPAGKDGLVLRSRTPRAAIITAPATMADPGDIVRINGARDVTLEGFTIAGPLPDALFCSLFPRSGVRVDGGGSATILGNRISDIRSADVAFRGCQNGAAVIVGSEREGEVGSARIEGNSIDGFQKTGILVENNGSNAVVVLNEITGDGPSTTIAQNGIQISFGADARVEGNWVSGEIYAPSPLSSAILLYAPGRTSVLGNQVRDADYGIITADAASPEIRGNTVSACTANGIDLDEETLGTTNAVVLDNESHDNGLDGIYVSALSSASTIRDNRMFADRELDARDDSVGKGTAGTASVWSRDRCKSDNHGGLLCEARH
jgi:parallel beta-helix repeat protein